MTSLDALQGLGGLSPVGTAGAVERPVAPGFDHALEGLLSQGTGHTQPTQEAPQRRAGGVRLSKHAATRLESRGLSFTEADRGQLEGALDELERRGAKKSLVLTGDRAWIVGVPKRTVITVLSRTEALGQVFTDLDSTFVAS